MAGHSKWHNIQHRKGSQDAKRGKIFTKLIKEIVVAAKTGGSVIENNPALRTAIDKALAANMKKDTIDHAIKRGSGELSNVNYERIHYEGYGINGTAVMVDCLTDNKKRTVAEVRNIFTKSGGNLGTNGSVAYLFTKKGIIGLADGDENSVIEATIDTAEDIIVNDDRSITVITSPQNFLASKTILQNKGFVVSYSDILEQPSTTVELGLTDAEKFFAFIEKLEDLDDVQNVHHNATISDDVAKQMQK